MFLRPSGTREQLLTVSSKLYNQAMLLQMTWVQSPALDGSSQPLVTSVPVALTPLLESIGPQTLLVCINLCRLMEIYINYKRKLELCIVVHEFNLSFQETKADGTL